ncbi:DUF4139 domain-containing protein [Magnetococcus sp. PR-3]|uniref:DUF4139 domain-containing protein n=1 Tax=Magnetococcus sp. PR-3 TaxID=3120355 RepID=UPI002FCE08C6
MPFQIHVLLMVCLALLFGPVHIAVASEIPVTVKDRKQVSITVYNSNLALVRDQRQVVLPDGVSTLAWQEVSTKMRPETALLRSVDAYSAVTVMEQNYHFDLLTPRKLLEKFTGKQVRVVKTHPTTGVEQVESAKILSTHGGGVVLRVGDRIETSIPGRIIFPDIPKDIRDRPTLTLMLSNPKAGKRAVSLNYLTGGLSWQANYVGQLNQAGDQMDLSGWVTLTNRSGAAYKKAQFQLISGTPNQVAQPRPMHAMAKGGRMERMMMADAAPAFAQEALFEYHLYTLERPATLLENQSKQLALFDSARVAVKKELVLQGHPALHKGLVAARRYKPTTYLVFINNKEANLGMPLPKGVVRLYTADAKGRAQFIGEDRIGHTAQKSKVRLKLGTAYDISAKRRRTEFEIIPKHLLSQGAVEAAYEVVIQNSKSEAVTVLIKEKLPANARILASSLPHTMEAAGQPVWQVKIPADDKVSLTYRMFAPR